MYILGACDFDSRGFCTIVLSGINRICDKNDYAFLLMRWFSQLGTILSLESKIITQWTKRHREGSIEYHSTTGFIEVKKKGYYYIYSQMYYYDGSTVLMGHHTYINHEKVMESAGSVTGPIRKYNTKYHGGVFLLQENDIITVRKPYSMHYFMISQASFFEAFLLGGLPSSGLPTLIIKATLIIISNICTGVGVYLAELSMEKFR